MSRSGDGGRARAVLVTLLSGLGGAYLLLMFLKIRGITGFREVSPEVGQWWSGLSLALIASAAAGIVGHVLFGVSAVPVVGRMGKPCGPRDLRTIWGLASFPVAVGFVILVLLDLLIAGREAYTSPEGDSLVTGWSVASLVLGASLGIWSLFLFVQGLSVAGGLRPSRAIMVVAVAGICLVPAALLGILAVAGLVVLTEVLIDIVQAVNK